MNPKEQALAGFAEILARKSWDTEAAHYDADLILLWFLDQTGNRGRMAKA